MINGILTAFSFLSETDWPKTIIIATVAAFVIACIIAFYQVQKKFMDEEEAEKNKKGARRRARKNKQ